MSIFAFGDKHPSFLRKTRSLPSRPVNGEHEHKVEEVGEVQSQDEEMRDEQSETETAESVVETCCKRQGYPIVGIARAPTHAESVIDEIEVTLREDSVAAATENDKKGQKKTVTFAEKIRVKEFEVDRTKEEKMRRNRRKRRAHDNDELDDDDESDADEPLAILRCALPLSKRHNLYCGCRLFLPFM